MATTAAPYGLRPINRIDGMPYAGATSQFLIDPAGEGTNLFYGQVVIIGADGYIALSTATGADVTTNNLGGSSVGAIVGSLYAYGYSWEDILNFLKNTQILDFKKYAINKPGFIDAEKFYPNLNEYIKEDNFSVLKKQLFITATDLLNGNLEVFSKGELIKEHKLTSSNEKNGTLVEFRPDDTIFKKYHFVHEYIDKMIWNYAFLNAGLTINFNHTHR